MFIFNSLLLEVEPFPFFCGYLYFFSCKFQNQLSHTLSLGVLIFFLLICKNALCIISISLSWFLCMANIFTFRHVLWNVLVVFDDEKILPLHGYNYLLLRVSSLQESWTNFVNTYLNRSAFLCLLLWHTEFIPSGIIWGQGWIFFPIFNQL